MRLRHLSMLSENRGTLSNFKFFIHALHCKMQSLSHPNIQKHMPAQSSEDQDTLHHSWQEISKIPTLSYWKHNTLYRLAVSLLGTGRRFANFANLVGPSAMIPAKPFLSIGLLPYLNFPQVTISLTLSCLGALAGSDAKGLGRTI